MGEASGFETEESKTLGIANGHNFYFFSDKISMRYNTSSESEHTEDKSYNCYVCHKSFSLKGNLKQHLRNIHKIEMSGKSTSNVQIKHNSEIESSKKRSLELNEENQDVMAD